MIALIIKISGGSITYGGSDTLSNSRGTGLVGDGSGGVIGNELVGPKKAVQPLLATSTADQANRSDAAWRENGKRHGISQIRVGRNDLGTELAHGSPPNR